MNFKPGSPEAHHRARIAALTRSRTYDDPELVEARRSLAFASLERKIRGTLAAHNLTSEQRYTLAALIAGQADR